MFFHQGVSANPLSRLLTVFAVVHDGRMRADHWGDQTIDKAIIGGHVYSDKAPLTSFLVIPVYAVWHATHRRAPEPVYENAAAQIGDVVTAAIPFALFAVMLERRAARAARAGANTGLGARIALLAAFSTCLFNYGNIFYSHMLSALLAVGAYVLALERDQYVLAGLVGGLGVLAEYPIALVDAVLVLGLLGPRAKGWRRAAAFVAGATPPAVLVLAYNVLVTGRPLDFPYSHVSDTWKTMRTAFGVRGPSFEAAWELVFGQYRGLLFYAPTLAVLGPLALRPPPREQVAEHRRWRFLVVICAIQFLFVCSYFKWDGGWCTGPRHLAPVIALVVLEGTGKLAATWPRLRLPFLVTAAFGIFVNLAAAATDPIPSESEVHPLFSVFLPQIAEGRINDHNFLAQWGLPNGSWIVAVWVALFALAVVLVSFVARRAERDPLRHGASAP